MLGTLVFLLCVTDLAEASLFETNLFADDTNLYLSQSNVKTLQVQVSSSPSLTGEKNIENWKSENKL